MKNPPKSIKGIIRTGTKVIAVFTSLKRVEINSPYDAECQ